MPGQRGVTCFHRVWAVARLCTDGPHRVSSEGVDPAFQESGSLQTSASFALRVVAE